MTSKEPLHLTICIKGHKAMLLAADADCLHPRRVLAVQGSTDGRRSALLLANAGCSCSVCGLAHILPYKRARLNPDRWVLLGAPRHVAFYNVIAGRPAGHDPALDGVEHQGLCALRANVQADNQRHGLVGGARNKLCTTGARRGRLTQSPCESEQSALSSHFAGKSGSVSRQSMRGASPSTSVLTE
jgi:hypothetical protein